MELDPASQPLTVLKTRSINVHISRYGYQAHALCGLYVYMYVFIHIYNNNNNNNTLHVGASVHRVQRLKWRPAGQPLHIVADLPAEMV